MPKDTDALSMAESFLRRAGIRLETALRNVQYHYPECVSDSQECIEFSVKAAMLCTAGDYPTKHRFTDEQAKILLGRIPEKLRYLGFHRLFLLSKFWTEFYTLAKYGNEELGLGPEKLFTNLEATLAAQHAEECYRAASQLVNYSRNPW